MKKSSAKKRLKTKGKRGGARPGAGRKPKPRNPEAAPNSNARPRKQVRLARVAMAPTEQTNRARKYALLAIDALADVAANADSANARNQAAELLLQWAYGKPLGIGDATMRPTADKLIKAKPLGKKEALVEAAKNPDPSTAMGDLMNQRAAQAKLNS